MFVKESDKAATVSNSLISTFFNASHNSYIPFPIEANIDGNTLFISFNPKKKS